MRLLNNEELDELARDLPYVEAWVSAVKSEIEAALREGVEFKNASLEYKIGNRAWRPGIDVLGFLRKFAKLDVIAPRVPLSPTQAEKVLGRTVYTDKIAKEVHRPVTGTKLVLR